MKLSSTDKHLQKFVYIDSSQEQQGQNTEEMKARNNKIFRQCLAYQDSNLSHNEYKHQLKAILKKEIEKIEGGNLIMVEANDKEIEQNFKMRKENYRFLIKHIQADEKYNKIMSEKISKVKEQNIRKELIFKMNKNKELMEKQQVLLKKYIIQKDHQQFKVINGMKQLVHKLGAQRNVAIVKTIKRKVQSEKTLTQNRLQDLRLKQKNELSQLREKYQQYKIYKKINKQDQERILRDLQKYNRKQKEVLRQKLTIKNTFIL